MVNHYSVARNTLAGKQLIAHIKYPDPVAGEDEDLYGWSKRHCIGIIMRDIARSLNCRRHGIVGAVPGREGYCHIVPKIATWSQDIKEQWLMTGTLESHAVRCPTFVQPRYVFDAEYAEACNPNNPLPVTRIPARYGSHVRKPQEKPGRGTGTRVGAKKPQLHSQSQPPKATRSAPDPADAAKAKLATYRRRIATGLKACSKFRKHSVRVGLLEEYGESPGRAKAPLTTASKAFKKEGLQPHVQSPLDSPEFAYLMGDMNLVEHIPAESFHVVRMMMERSVGVSLLSAVCLTDKQRSVSAISIMG